MNLPTYERAQLAAFAYDEARHTGNLECLRAICFVLRNRVRAGWSGSSWLGVMVQAMDERPPKPKPPTFEPNDRLLQMIIRDVDDIYTGADRNDDSTRMIVLGDNPPKTAALYYMFVNQPAESRFSDGIVRRPTEHPQTGNIGPLMLFR